MDEALTKHWPVTEQDRRISEAVGREQVRLRKFILRERLQAIYDEFRET